MRTATTVRLAGRQLCPASPITFTPPRQVSSELEKIGWAWITGLLPSGACVEQSRLHRKLFSAASVTYGLVTSSVDMAATLALQITRFAEEERPVAGAT